MTIIVKAVSDSFGNLEELGVSENFVKYSCTLKVNGSSFDGESFKARIAKVHSVLYKEFQQKFEYARLICRIGLSNPISISLTDPALSEENLSDIKDSFFSFDNESDHIELDFDITKEKYKVNYILSLKKFFDYLYGLSFEESLVQWSFLSYYNSISFFFWDDCINFSSSTINFYNVNESFLARNIDFDREKYITLRDKTSYFKNNKSITLIPVDFSFGKQVPVEFGEYFNKLKIALLSIFLADSSEINGNILSYRLKGYKLISDKVDVNHIDLKSIDELYNIFMWSYNDGNFIDKIGLARNIVTIHTNEKSIFSVEEGTLNSLSSGYDIYLKDNVKQYIDIKNKLSEFIVAQSDKSIEITKNMYAGLKLTLWTLITFFMVNFISKIFKLDSGSIVFSNQALAISIVFIIISFIYLVISWLEVDSDIKNMKERFDLVEGRYKDLLDIKDLEKALKKDQVFDQQSNWIKDKRKVYTIAWSIINLVLIISAWLFWYYF